MTTVERWASRVLLVGGLLSVALMVSGLLGIMLVGTEWRAAPPVAFAIEGDRRFVTVAAIVVAMLALSVWCGAG